jgi:hypothetical protein
MEGALAQEAMASDGILYGDAYNREAFAAGTKAHALLHRLQYMGRLRSCHGNKFHGPGDWAADCPLRIEECRNMPLIDLIVPLIVVGVVLWLINNYIPMASSIKRIVNVVVVVIVAVWVLQAVGLWSPVTTYRLNMR